MSKEFVYFVAQLKKQIPVTENEVPVTDNEVPATEASAPRRRRKWRIALWVLLTPVLLFVVLMALLYVPPVQHFIRGQVVRMASEATGMNIDVQRVDLRFPLNLLVRGVLVTQPRDSLHSVTDTLLQVERLNVHVQAMPLFKGQIELDDVTLTGASVNSGRLLEGMHVRGTLGKFSLQSHGIDLNREDVTLDNVTLDDTHVRVLLADTTTAVEDTAATALRWRVNLQNLALRNVSVDLALPLDTMRVMARLGEALLQDALVDLREEAYGWRKFSLSGSSVKYDSGGARQLFNDTLLVAHTDTLSLADKDTLIVTTDTIVSQRMGLDPSHIALRGVNVGIDSVYYCGKEARAIIRRFSMYERCGLAVNSLTARIASDSATVRVPYLRMTTPHSEINVKAHTYWRLIDMPTTGKLSVSLDANIGKQDVMLLAGALPPSFKEAYPFRPLVVHAHTEGNLRDMHLSRFHIELPGAFHLSGGGDFHDLTDGMKRQGRVDLDMQTLNLNFLTALGGTLPDASLQIPDSMNLAARFVMNGPQCNAMLDLAEHKGVLDLDAAYNLTTEAYKADLSVKNLQIDHFLPRDSIYTLSATLAAQGQGTDLLSSRTVAKLDFMLDELLYKEERISDIGLQARLHDAVANVDVQSAYSRLPFTLNVEARPDSSGLKLQSGDLNLQMRTRTAVNELIGQSMNFAGVLMKQLEEKHLNHAALRRALPSAGMFLTAGNENPIADMLAGQGIRYDKVLLDFGANPQVGINGRTALHGFRTDSIQLDTLFFAIHQDTTRMTLQGGVANAPNHPHVVFRSTLTGEIRNDDAELTLKFVDSKGDTGILFGINARPLTEGNGKGNGLLLQLIPEEPVIAYRKFRFADKKNWIYLHKNMRVYAGVDMDSDDGLGFRMLSSPKDTVSLQNIDIELSRLHLSDLVSVVPYMPQLTGLFSVEANYIQTGNSLQVAAEAVVDSLTYEQQPVGNIGMGVTWLPAEEQKHYLNGYLSLDHQEVLTADGMVQTLADKETLDVTASLQHFPLGIANAFIPGRAAELTGDVDGEVMIGGNSIKPVVNGALSLDSVSLFARQVGARYWFDARPVQVVENRLLFDKFAIYTTSRNPFTIDGNVDFRNLDRPAANLTLAATNYTLLDAPRTRESLVYGKVYVDLNARIRGPLDGLTMRGNMNVLGNTNATYVLTDTPLTVEDRLDGLVSFVSFTDTTSVAAEETPVMSLGGLEMSMGVHIDDAVRLRADLSADRSKYIELMGGGDLQMLYTPQGDMTLTGRYTLSGGSMKYSLPVIPLKEFSFNPGSYVDWRGDIMNPTLDLKATERIRASVSGTDDAGAARMVNFDVSIAIKDKLSAPELIFDINAPEDATVQNELQSMSVEERSKQAIAMLATGIYLNGGGSGGGLTMGAALNSVLQSQINSLAGGLHNASISVGVEDRTSAETGDTQKDFSFRYAQRFFNDRVQIVIGGKVSTGANATNSAESFIDNISVEYRLDRGGTRYVRAFHNKNYESVLDGEITETGVGLVLRRKVDRLGELFIFRRNKNKPQPAETTPKTEKE